MWMTELFAVIRMHSVSGYAPDAFFLKTNRDVSLRMGAALGESADDDVENRREEQAEE